MELQFAAVSEDLKYLVSEDQGMAGALPVQTAVPYGCFLCGFSSLPVTSPYLSSLYRLYEEPPTEIN